MRRLTRARRSAGDAGTPLPDIFPALKEKGIRIRRAQVTLVVAVPNSGKSLWTLYCATRWAEKGLGVLYLSADTDEADNYKRMAAMLSGHTQAQVEAELEGESSAINYYDDLIDEVEKLRFDFDTDPNFDTIVEEVLAYLELWGEYPAVIVIDNLGNVQPTSEDEWKSLHETIKFSKRMARITGAAVVIPHHANEVSGDPKYPPTRKDITGKVAKYPDGAIGVSIDDDMGVMRFASLKNRGARKDASGKSYVELHLDADRMQYYASKWHRENGIAL